MRADTPMHRVMRCPARSKICRARRDHAPESRPRQIRLPQIRGLRWRFGRRQGRRIQRIEVRRGGKFWWQADTRRQHGCARGADQRIRLRSRLQDCARGSTSIPATAPVWRAPRLPRGGRLRGGGACFVALRLSAIDRFDIRCAGRRVRRCALGSARLRPRHRCLRGGFGIGGRRIRSGIGRRPFRRAVPRNTGGGGIRAAAAGVAGSRVV